MCFSSGLTLGLDNYFPQITQLSLITLDTFDVTSLRQQQWNLLLKGTSGSQWEAAASVERPIRGVGRRDPSDSRMSSSRVRAGPEEVWCLALQDCVFWRWEAGATEIPHSYRLLFQSNVFNMKGMNVRPGLGRVTACTRAPIMKKCRRFTKGLDTVLESKYIYWSSLRGLLEYFPFSLFYTSAPHFRGGKSWGKHDTLENFLSVYKVVKMSSTLSNYNIRMLQIH